MRWPIRDYYVSQPPKNTVRNFRSATMVSMRGIEPLSLPRQGSIMPIIRHGCMVPLMSIELICSLGNEFYRLAALLKRLQWHAWAVSLPIRSFDITEQKSKERRLSVIAITFYSNNLSAKGFLRIDYLSYATSLSSHTITVDCT